LINILAFVNNAGVRLWLKSFKADVDTADFLTAPIVHQNLEAATATNTPVKYDSATYTDNNRYRYFLHKSQSFSLRYLSIGRHCRICSQTYPA